MRKIGAKGFTLAELLVSLAILGEIATFTIPKIMSAQRNGSNNANAKEVMAMIAAAHQQAQVAGTITSATKGADLTSYMNYVNVATSGTIDSHPGYAGGAGSGQETCNATNPCLRLHNGGVLLATANTFTANTYIMFLFDPDRSVTGTTADGPSKSVQFYLTSTGRLFTRATVPGGENAALDPSWFSW